MDAKNDWLVCTNSFNAMMHRWCSEEVIFGTPRVFQVTLGNLFFVITKKIQILSDATSSSLYQWWNLENSLPRYTKSFIFDDKVFTMKASWGFA